jgi:hypothetical protein
MRVTTVGKLLFGVAACAAMLLGPGNTFGSLMVHDSFTYPDGSLVGQTPEIGGTWANHSGTVGQLQVVSGQAKVDHALSEDAHTDFAGGPMGAGDKFYAAFDLTVPPQAAAPGTVYFAHFKDAGNFFGARVFITAPAVAGNGYRLGISGNSTLIASETWGSDLAFGTTYRVVTSADFDSPDSQIWVNPVNESSTSVTATDGFAGDEFESYALRQSTSNSMQLIDNLCVASTFGQALNCVPEPASMALAALAGMMLVGVSRRRVR